MGAVNNLPCSLLVELSSLAPGGAYIGIEARAVHSAGGHVPGLGRVFLAHGWRGGVVAVGEVVS